MQLIYASLVGVLTGLPLSVGPISTTPEFALIIGNVFSYFVSFRQRLVLSFLEKKKFAPHIYEFIFKKNETFPFFPGQYMEWTLPSGRTDIRGNRRFFTLASSPTEKDVRIGVRVNDKGSDFKEKLINLKNGDKIYAGNLAGDFTLLEKSQEKYLFIAGGIGITPFRSMVKSAVDRNKKLDAVLLYACKNDDEFVYSEIFEKAKAIGLDTKYICTHPNIEWNGLKGRVDFGLIKKEVPDFNTRKIYISGPNRLVKGIKLQLLKAGVSPFNIVTDYFSGY